MTPLNGYVVLKKLPKESTGGIMLVEKKDTELTKFEIVHPGDSGLAIGDIILTNHYLVEEIDGHFLCKERNLVAKVS